MLRTDHAHNTAGLLSSPVAEAARGGAGSRATSGGHRSRLATSADEQEIGGTEKRPDSHRSTEQPIASAVKSVSVSG